MPPTAWVLFAAGLLGAWSSGGGTPYRPPSSPRSVWDGVYTAAQAVRGEALYRQTCARCHGVALTGGEAAPALAGIVFLTSWNGLTLGDLYERIRTSMPSDKPGSLGRQTVTDVVAFLLRQNQFPAGAAELPADGVRLREIAIEASRP